MTANFVEVTDTFPAGMSFAPSNTGWVDSGDGSAVLTSTDPLGPGETLRISLFLVLMMRRWVRMRTWRDLC
ncbi:MAG: hypothetical protein H6512_11590 [Acidimicrobiia bacterium]|nr:hypothetical protein [Acidimicrobiia bacterium]